MKCITVHQQCLCECDILTKESLEPEQLRKLINFSLYLRVVGQNYIFFIFCNIFFMVRVS